MKNVMKAIVVIIVALMVLIPFASTYPDGLEKVAESLGIVEPEPLWEGLMPDYQFPTTESSYFGMFISGLIGVFLVCGAAWILGLAASHKNKNSKGS
jgi:ABC-type sulfate transport system permease component